MAAMKPNTITVIKFLQAHADEDLTAQDVADQTGLNKRQVDGIFTSAIARKGFGLREEAEVELANGDHQKVKFLRLTADGVNLDVDAPAEEE